MGGGAIWRNYLIVTLRSIERHRAYAFVTVAGLALGIAACLLILAYVRHERTYDAWQPGSDRLYQVQTTIRPPGQPIVHTQASSFSVQERFIADFPQVAAVTSVSIGKTVTERDGAPVFIEATTVDPSFFDVFHLPFVQGSPKTALRDINAIVLTEAEAIRWFGTTQALGKRLTLGAGDGKRDYRVSAVLRDLPRNTNLKLGLIFPRDLNAIPEGRRQWGNFDNQHFVRLRAGADPADVNAGLPAWEKRVIPTIDIAGRREDLSESFDHRLVAIGEVHLGAAQEGAQVPGGDPRTVATFGIVALLTLGMAIINFVNLTTARATQRAREVALRKTLGATRRQLIGQFLAESALLTGVAMMIAFAIVEVASGWIGALLGADLPVTYLGAGGMLAPALLLLPIVALASGLYPAFYLSRFTPAQVLRAGKGEAETIGGGRLRVLLVVTQFAIAIGLIASTTVIFSQTRFVETVNPGYRRDGLIQIDNAWRFSERTHFESARTAMLAVPGVTEIGRTGLGLGSSYKRVRLIRAPGETEYRSTGFYGIDAHTLDTMGIDLLAGRMLGDRFAADFAQGKPAGAPLNIVVNRVAIGALGLRSAETAVGKTIELEWGGGNMNAAVIVGVVEDTRFRTARDVIEPMVFVYDPTLTSQLVVRYVNARPGEVMAGLERVWRRFEPEIPFEARYADDIVREIYAADRARGILFAIFSGLAVVIACLGLYSLSSFTTERRTKEIGIRKVFGARVRDIVRLLAWQFSKPVVLANLVAWPAAWWTMREWLNGFDLRIALGPAPFLIASLLALAIALGTVSGQAIRVARQNPIHALRYE